MAFDETHRPDHSGQTVYVDIGHCTSAVKNPLTGKEEVDGGFSGLAGSEYSECSINKRVGMNLINLLRDEGIRVVPTWDPNNPPPLVSKAEDLKRRVDAVNNDVALHPEQDAIYVSIHHDNDERGVSGQSAFYAITKGDEPMPLAKSIQQSAWHVRTRENNEFGIFPDTQTGNGKLVGLRGVNVPGVLIEGANVRNEGDRALMPQSSFQLMEAQHIARGIVNYYALKKGVERP